MQCFLLTSLRIGRDDSREFVMLTFVVVFA